MSRFTSLLLVRGRLEGAEKNEAIGVSALTPEVPTWLRMSFRPGPRLSRPATFRFQVTGSFPNTMELTCWGDEFDSSSPQGVIVTNEANGYVVADAVRFVPV